MTIEESIKHCKEVAEENRKSIKCYEQRCDVCSFHKSCSRVNQCTDCSAYQECEECAKEHEQLAEWLEELIVLRKAYKLACSELEKHANNPNCELEPISNRGKEAIQEYFIDKVKEKLQNDD